MLCQEGGCLNYWNPSRGSGFKGPFLNLENLSEHNVILCSAIGRNVYAGDRNTMQHWWFATGIAPLFVARRSERLAEKAGYMQDSFNTVTRSG